MSRETRQRPADFEIASQSAIEHLLRHRPERIRTLLVSKSSAPRVNEIIQLAKNAKITVDTSQSHAEPVRALIQPYEYTDLGKIASQAKTKPRSLLVALDHLQDPQNLGAIARSAEGLGASGIIIPKDRGVTVSPGSYHASVGAVDTIPIALVGNLGESLRKLKDEGFWIVGTCLGKNATSFDKMPNFEHVVLVLGAELTGISPSLEKTCDWLLEIPLPGKVQSLNVSAAGAIMIYELLNRKI